MTGHPDEEVLRPIADTILTLAGGQANLSSGVGFLLRECFDRVINTPKTGRRLIEELYAPEKTYIGTCVENELQYFLRLRRGTELDFQLAGVDVDLKFSIADSWMIPPEAFGRPCIILSAGRGHSAILVWAAPRSTRVPHERESRQEVRDQQAGKAEHRLDCEGRSVSP